MYLFVCWHAYLIILIITEPDDYPGYGRYTSASQLATDYIQMKMSVENMPGAGEFQVIGPSVTQLSHPRAQKLFSE